MARASSIPAGDADRDGRARRPASQDAARRQDVTAEVAGPVPAQGPGDSRAAGAPSGSSRAPAERALSEIGGPPPGSIIGDQLGPAVSVQVQRLPAGALLVHLSGPVDQRNCSNLPRRVLEATGAGPTPPRLLLDLTGVTFLDHAGLDALLHLQEMWAGADGVVELLSPSASVVRLLHDAELNGESWMQSGNDDPADQPPP